MSPYAGQGKTTGVQVPPAKNWAPVLSTGWRVGAFALSQVGTMTLASSILIATGFGELPLYPACQASGEGRRRDRRRAPELSERFH